MGEEGYSEQKLQIDRTGQGHHGHPAECGAVPSHSGVGGIRKLYIVPGLCDGEDIASEDNNEAKNATDHQPANEVTFQEPGNLLVHYQATEQLHSLTKKSKKQYT